MTPACCSGDSSGQASSTRPAPARESSVTPPTGRPDRPSVRPQGTPTGAATRRSSYRGGHEGGLDRPRRAGRRHRAGAGGRRRAEGRQRPPRHRDEPGARGLPALPERHAHDPSDPHWLGRDRFVLSCGHSSLTQYIQLYLSGYGLELKDLKALRTWGSLTPGHPEVHHTTGVEITTGPLGSGLASAVGMAMAQRRQRGLLDPDAKPGESPFDHHVWVLASDGDLMEGVAPRPPRSPGTRSSATSRSSTTPTRSPSRTTPTSRSARTSRKRYEAYGWDVDTSTGAADRRRRGGTTTSRTSTPCSPRSRRQDGRATSRPSSSCTRSSPGPPPPSRTPASRTARPWATPRSPPPRSCSGFDPEKTFEVDEDVLAHAREVRTRGKAAHKAWDKRYAAWRKAQRRARRRCSTGSSTGELPDGLRQGACPTSRPTRQGPGDPRGIRQGARRAGRRPARAVGRLGRPRRVQQHDDGRRAVVHPHGQADPRVEGRARTGAPCTSASARTPWA